MSYCTKCGREITDEAFGCSVCNAQNQYGTNFEKETIDSFTVEDQNGNSQRFENRAGADGTTEPRPAQEPQTPQSIPTILKILAIVAVLFTGGIGTIGGLVAGVILAKSPIADYASFGKLLLILSGVLLAFWILACLVGSIFGIIGGTFSIFGNIISLIFN